MSRNGETVSAFERELASYCGAKFAIAAANGTATLEAALVAIGVQPGDRVAVPPLTMAASAIAILNACAEPVFVDVNPRTWLMQSDRVDEHKWSLPVSLYGLHWRSPQWATWASTHIVDDAAQTLRQHDSGAAFTSISFQHSKILSTGEGGALLTDDEELASRARSYLSLGYRMASTQARIDSAALKSPTFDRHHRWPAINGRMNDITAAEGLKRLGAAGQPANELLQERSIAAAFYRKAIDGCGWLVPQHVPEGFTHDWWTYAVACDSPDRALRIADAVVKHGGERPYPAWRLTYDEPAFEHLAPRCSVCGHRVNDGFPRLPCCVGVGCPVAESLQPRLLQFQTNDLASAERNAGALRKAIEELS